MQLSECLAVAVHLLVALCGASCEDQDLVALAVGVSTFTAMRAPSTTGVPTLTDLPSLTSRTFVQLHVLAFLGLEAVDLQLLALLHLVLLAGDIDDGVHDFSEMGREGGSSAFHKCLWTVMWAGSSRPPGPSPLPSPNAFLTAGRAFRSSQGNRRTFALVLCPALLKTLVTVRGWRPMWPYRRRSRRRWGAQLEALLDEVRPHVELLHGPGSGGRLPPSLRATRAVP